MEEHAKTYNVNPTEVLRMFEDIVSGEITHIKFSDGREYKIILERVQEEADENNTDV